MNPPLLLRALPRPLTRPADTACFALQPRGRSAMSPAVMAVFPRNVSEECFERQNRREARAAQELTTLRLAAGESMLLPVRQMVRLLREGLTNGMRSSKTTH